MEEWDGSGEIRGEVISSTTRKTKGGERLTRRGARNSLGDVASSAVVPAVTAWPFQNSPNALCQDRY